jgi:hypothetical protein
MVELKDGRWLMVWSGLNASYSDDRGRTWSASEPLQTGDEPIIGTGAPTCLLRLQSGKLGLLYGHLSGTAGGTLAGYALCFRTSDDEGKSWSEETAINLPGETASNYHDVLFQLRSGRLVLPTRFCPPCTFPELKDAGAYGTFQGKRFKTEGHAHGPEIDTSQVYFSDDDGATWKRCPQDIVIWHQDGYGGMWPCDEPGAVQLRDGRLLMMFRTTLGRLYQSFSNDEGLTWSLPQPTELASSYSPCRLRIIPTTGDLLCVWNQVSRDEIRRGFRRSRLSLAISTDDGDSWNDFKTLEVGGPADRDNRIAPDDKIGMVRGKKELGELPTDMIYVSYPNAHFFGDEVVLLYDFGPQLDASTDPPSWPRHRKIVIHPIEWLYEEI